MASTFCLDNPGHHFCRNKKYAAPKSFDVISVRGGSKIGQTQLSRGHSHGGSCCASCAAGLPCEGEKKEIPWKLIGLAVLGYWWFTRDEKKA